MCYRSAVTPCATKHELEPIAVLNGERLAVHPQRGERHRHRFKLSGRVQPRRALIARVVIIAAENSPSSHR